MEGVPIFSDFESMHALSNAHPDMFDEDQLGAFTHYLRVYIDGELDSEFDGLDSEAHRDLGHMALELADKVDADVLLSVDMIEEEADEKAANEEARSDYDHDMWKESRAVDRETKGNIDSLFDSL